MRSLSILYIGSFEYGEGSTSWQRMDAMRDLGHDVTALDINTKLSLWLGKLIVVRIVRRIIGNSIDLGFVNVKAKNLIDDNAFDVLWLDKPIVVKPKLLEYFKRKFPRARILGYSPDDCMNPGNQSRRFIAALPLFDMFCTTKSYNCAELEAMGCKCPLFVGNAYHTKLHRPVPLSSLEKKMYGGDVVFIGSWEADRANSIEALSKSGVEIRIWGGGWGRWKSPPDNVTIEHKSLFGDRYTKVLNASKINLCFLRKINRDLQTTRSIEIPACSSFMLAERTKEHLSLFEEGREAEYFSTDGELVEKVEYYLKHDRKREVIAKQGRERCLRSGYSNKARIKLVLDKGFENMESNV